MIKFLFWASVISLLFVVVCISISLNLYAHTGMPPAPLVMWAMLVAVVVLVICVIVFLLIAK